MMQRVGQKTILYWLNAAVALQSVAFLTMTVYWLRVKSVNHEPKATQLCTDCEILSTIYDKQNINRQVEKLRISPSSKCCGEIEEILHHALQKETMFLYYSRRRQTVTEAVYNLCDSYKDQKPFVKAVGVLGVKRIGELFKLLLNEHGATIEGPSTQHMAHIIDEGEIFIRSAGHYRVLSKLVITTNNSSQGDAIFSHYIYVLSHKIGTRRLLGETRMSLEDQTQTNSIFSAVFQLDLHDRLYVIVSHQEYIDMSSHENIFCVYHF